MHLIRSGEVRMYVDY